VWYVPVTKEGSTEYSGTQLRHRERDWVTCVVINECRINRGGEWYLGDSKGKIYQDKIQACGHVNVLSQWLILVFSYSYNLGTTKLGYSAIILNFHMLDSEKRIAVCYFVTFLLLKHFSGALSMSFRLDLPNFALYLNCILTTILIWRIVTFSRHNSNFNHVWNY